MPLILSCEERRYSKDIKLGARGLRFRIIELCTYAYYVLKMLDAIEEILKQGYC